MSDAEARATDLRRAGLGVAPFAGDLADPAAAADLARRITTVSGDQTHALIHLAGGFAMSGPVAESDPAVFRRMLEINLATAYGASRAFLPSLRAARGALVFVAGLAALPGGRAAGISAYAAAKAGLVALTRAIAQEERERGVRSNAVAPSAIRTAANLASMGDKVRYVERESVADVIVFLCSDAARNVTGQVIELS
jgi:3-oxoacyl-[acyl-carrier protein] reductase